MEDGTFTTLVRENSEALTLDTIREAMEKVWALGPMPYFYYSWAIPMDTVFYGDFVDQVMQKLVPGFNPKMHKGFMVSKRWEEELKHITEGSFGNSTPR
jgi:hypothetical protein